MEARNDTDGSATTENGRTAVTAADPPDASGLARARAELVARLDETRVRLDRVELELMSTEARLAALEGEAAAHRARLRFEIDDAAQAHADAEGDAEYAEMRRARDAERKARRRLADVEAEVAGMTPPLASTVSALSTQRESLRFAERELLQELAATDAALRRLELEQQAARTRELEQKVSELEPVVREAAGGSGIADLGKDYEAQADGHKRAWKWWGALLLAAVVVAVGGSLLLFASERVPTGAVDSEAIVTIARNLLVVGLLLYLVRLTSLQFRVHRHLEAVARNKAAALSTFNRIVGVSGEPEVRNSIATVLAQAVFSSEDTGFIDGSDGHITLVERVAAGLPRGPVR